MTMNIKLSLFFYVIIFCVIKFVYTIECDHPQECYFVEMEDNYYGVFIENEPPPACLDKYVPSHFFGLCDGETLSQWDPCPFSSSGDDCRPNSNRMYHKMCDIREVMKQANCKCKGQIESRELQPVPDFPTCYLEELDIKIKPIPPAKSNGESAPVINNCNRCMTKHPQNLGTVEVASLNSRVKRDEMPLPNLKNSETMEDEKLFGQPSSKTEFRQYRSYVSQFLRDKEIRFGKPVNSERVLEKRSNFALNRILRAISKSHAIFKRQEKEEIEEDDDENEDENAGEDIAIEESNNNTDVPQPIDIGEPDELNEIENQLPSNHNITADVNEDDKEGPKLNTSQSFDISIYIFVISNLFILQF